MFSFQNHIQFSLLWATVLASSVTGFLHYVRQVTKYLAVWSTWFLSTRINSTQIHDTPAFQPINFAPLI